MNKFARIVPGGRRLAGRFGAVATGLLASVPAFAEDPATAIAGATSLSTGNTAFGPVFWGMAVVSTGIMIGVMWIKRAKRAA